jgi:hypothetical protein
MKVWELLNGVVQDSRIGNHFGVQECWTMYFNRYIEKEYERMGYFIDPEIKYSQSGSVYNN